MTELCFCCLQFGGMFLAPMMLLMELTLPLENVLGLICVCLGSFNEKCYYMPSSVNCDAQHDPFLFFFLPILVTWNLENIFCLDFFCQHNWRTTRSSWPKCPHKCIVTCNPVVAFSVVILICGCIQRCWDCRSKT